MNMFTSSLSYKEKMVLKGLKKSLGFMKFISFQTKNQRPQVSLSGEPSKRKRKKLRLQNEEIESESEIER